MSFKKLRLDPELPPSHRNQLGANESGGRGFMDGSSFSSSTSGGSGAYGRSSGPFRTRYSQPMGAASPSPSFSRFAPYYFGKERRASVRVPLIRARRDDSDSEGYRPSSRASLNSSLGGESTASATSTTAQRIIETLQNLSTPVMNAGKIRIDQGIKAIPPMSFGGGSSISKMSPGGTLNRSTGPPKMCSSLLLTNPSPANQTSPIFNAGEQRRLFCIPKMVDAATNTDKDETRSPAPAQASFQSKSPVVASKPPFSGVNFKPSTPVPAKEDIDGDDEVQDSRFKFSSPWAPTIFDRFLTNVKEDKSTAKNLPGQQPLMNGFKDVTSNQSNSSLSKTSPAASSSPFSTVKSTTPSMPSFSGSSGGFGISPMKEASFGKPPNSSAINTDSLKSSKSSENDSGRSSAVSGFSFGQSPLNKSDTSKSLFGSGMQSKGALSISAASVDKVDSPKTDGLFASKASGDMGSKSTLPPLSTLSQSNASKWRCPICMADNDATVSACLCCGEKNTNQQAAKISADKEVKKKWRCSMCMVENEASAASCVCCTEKNPNPVVPAASSSATVPVNKKWRCSTCLIDNEASAARCVCCTEKNPNPTIQGNAVPAAGTAAVPSFSFGVSSSAAASSSKSSFSFGAPVAKEASNTGTSEFKFGVSAPSTNATPAPAAAAAPSTTPGFKFGSVSVAAPTAPPTFGFPAAPATISPPATAASAAATASPAFSLAKTSDVNNSSASSAGIFSSSTFPSAQPPSNSFKFGSTSTNETLGGTGDTPKPASAPSFSFGASPVTKPAFNSFSFGDRQQNTTGGLANPTPSTIAPVSSTPAPAAAPALGAPAFAFGSSNSTSSPFGLSMPKSPPQPTGGFGAFGSSTTANPPTPSLAATPSFALTPNLNFGATPGSSIPFGNPSQPTPGSQPPPSLFQFNATPTADSPGGRKIKRAVRRFNK